ncbi:MAG: 4Fe-4S dicluster domain-containing protein [Bacteroidetes bacterium]|nr:MAG: 4Fe-4S dicluster domain-containing protein [Bacteroidota bacterium]
MKENKKRYWKGLEQLDNDPEFIKYANKEFPEYLPINGNQDGQNSGLETRRDFLKMMGFSVAAASLAACEAPIRKAIPYLNKPVDINPGTANFYASTYLNGGDYCSIVVKTREGRPIKVEGNKLSKITKGGVNAQVEASVLSLYDDERLRGPRSSTSGAEWDEIDSQIKIKLSEITSANGQIRIVSNTVLSPATKAAIDVFLTKYPSAQHVMYDQLSSYGIVKANQQSFGSAVIPSYDFSKAQVIVSFDADFLGTWISPIVFSSQYSTTRKLSDGKKTMSRHYQFESNLSLTGANADYRTGIRPSQQGLAVAALYNLIAAKAGALRASVSNLEVEYLSKAANELWESKGKSLVVSGSNDVSVQILVNAINDLLVNYGETIDLNTPVYYRQGNDEVMNQFITDVDNGNIDAVIFYNANPVYDHPRGNQLGNSLSKVELKISTSDRPDETANLMDFMAPDHHYLESWNDANPKKGFYSLAQPTITPLFNTRQAQESFLVWAENDVNNYHTFLQNYWRDNFYIIQNTTNDFQTFWDETLYDGVLNEVTEGNNQDQNTNSFSADFTSVEQAINNNYAANNTGFEIAIYQKIGIGNGAMANNPLLHELPDPITKVTWDNYITISQSDASDLGLAMLEDKTNKIDITIGGNTYSLPALIQPGQAKGTLGIALGYGRTNAGRVAQNLGVNIYPLTMGKDGMQTTSVTTDVQVVLTSVNYRLARTQTHQTYMGREIVIQESTLGEYQQDPSAGRYHPYVSTWMEPDHKKRAVDISMWKGHKYKNHHWGLIVDMNSCTGCSACIMACNVENNIPVVGKQEVLNRREMHWLRIDRYYSSDATKENRKGMEKPSENPEITFQPMMCQHCNNAPCETVCPVAATTHSSEGLNQMVYNRCIGTRYCANNCPYKVRRFNWFKYHDNEQFAVTNPAMNTDLGKMVLNPDVTVRSRGVMEKCSFCVQRIQAGKLKAKLKGRRPIDGEITTACVSSCPTNALVFGDMLDEKSEISKRLKFGEDDEGRRTVGEERAYHVLEGIGVSPNVFYLTKIRNKDKAEA